MRSMSVGRSTYRSSNTPVRVHDRLRVATHRVLEALRDLHELGRQLPRQDVQGAQRRQVRQELAVRGGVERPDAHDLGVDCLTAGLDYGHLIARHLTARGHLALDLDPQALELGGRGRNAGGGEFSQPHISSGLPTRRRELRGYQRLLQSRRDVVRDLARQAEDFREAEHLRLLAKLAIELADADLVRGVLVSQLLRGSIQGVPLLLRALRKRLLLLRRRVVEFLDRGLELLLLCRSGLLDFLEQGLRGAGASRLLGNGRGRERCQCRSGEESYCCSDHDRTSCGAGTGTVSKS
jgi:hypothetical protein